MIGIITGDIILSQKQAHPEDWLFPLRKLLSTMGKEPKNWEIFRGDSFQLEVEHVEECFFDAIRIKANIKKIKNADVRMAIGIGEKNYDAQKITESNGSAFIYSGQLFEKQKRIGQNIVMKSKWDDFDGNINLLLKLSLIAMDNWKQDSAELVAEMFNVPNVSQIAIGKRLGISQSAVSQRKKTAHYDAIMEVEKKFRKMIKKYIE